MKTYRVQDDKGRFLCAYSTGKDYWDSEGRAIAFAKRRYYRSSGLRVVEYELLETRSISITDIMDKEEKLKLEKQEKRALREKKRLEKLAKKQAKEDTSKLFEFVADAREQMKNG